MRLKSNIIHIFKYSLIGGSAALTDMAIFYVFVKRMGLNYILISIAGFLIATLVNYIFGILFLFKSKIRYNRNVEMFLIYVVSGIGLLVHLIVLYITIDMLYLPKMLAKVMAIGSAFMWNYLSRTKVIFSEKYSNY